MVERRKGGGAGDGEWGQAMKGGVGEGGGPGSPAGQSGAGPSLFWTISSFESRV